jgi:hypothetical protein
MSEENNSTTMIRTALFERDYEPEFVEITVRIRVDQQFALSLIQDAIKNENGKRKSVSELVEEALDLLIEKHLIAVRLPKSRALTRQK